MDKETVIELTKGNGDMLACIYEYCIEMGKEKFEVSKFIIVLVKSPYLSICFRHALEYYQRKYKLCILYNNRGVILDAY